MSIPNAAFFQKTNRKVEKQVPIQSSKRFSDRSTQVTDHHYFAFTDRDNGDEIIKIVEVMKQLLKTKMHAILSGF